MNGSISKPTCVTATSHGAHPHLMSPSILPYSQQTSRPGLYLRSVSQVLLHTPLTTTQVHFVPPALAQHPAQDPLRNASPQPAFISSLPAAPCSWPSHMPWSTGFPSVSQHNIGGKPPAQGGQGNEDNVVSAFENSLSEGKDRCLGLSAKRYRLEYMRAERTRGSGDRGDGGGGAAIPQCI